MRILNVIFYVRNIQKSKEFYHKLGFNLVQDFGNFVSYDVGQKDQYFSIMQSDDEMKVPGKQVCVFWTDNIHELFEKVNQINIKGEDQITKASYGETLTIWDFDGNKIEFVQGKQ